MRGVIFNTLLYFGYAYCKLWPKGIVHYDISQKDYDLHSQNEIQSTLSQVEKEICVKFFRTPSNHSGETQVLFISNPGKRKTCPPDPYDYTRDVVEMTIGYDCLNKKNTAKIIMDMLKASVEPTPVQNSYDLIRKFQEHNTDSSQTTLLSAADRNFVNAYYHHECRSLHAPAHAVPARRTEAGPDLWMSPENREYYRDKVWPLGIVMWAVEPDSLTMKLQHKLKEAMDTIMRTSCVVFYNIVADKSNGTLYPKNFLYFSKSGQEEPELGFRRGNQSITLSSFVLSKPYHPAHLLNNLMRVLGVPMTSNRYDRDNFVTIHWRNVKQGKKYLLEKSPKQSWIRAVPYDFESVSHAPVNYQCSADCQKNFAWTMQPVQDQTWQRATSMGQHARLSELDKLMLNLLYGSECDRRNM